MDIPKYDGNIHPDEWISDIQKYFKLRKIDVNDYLEIAILLVDSTISFSTLSTEINSFEKLRDTLKSDISFTVFKNTNKRKLQSLKYIPEQEGGDTSKFISTFRKLCYNAEINDIEEQKKYLFKSLPMNRFDYISNEFYEKVKNVNSINELIKEFEEIVLEESILIKNGFIVALKHVATGKYLSSIENLCYKTGSKNQLVFAAGSPELVPNSLWKIKFELDKELATHTVTSITLQHIKSDKSLGIIYYYRKHDNIYGRRSFYHKSPSTEHSEVSCVVGYDKYWKFNHSKLGNYRGYLKSNDIINLKIEKRDKYYAYYNVQDEFLRSHDIQFTIGGNTFQEVVCHNERLGGSDEWRIELIKQS